MILAEIFVYVRSHAHVRFAIPQNPLGGPFSAMHASVMHLCTHVASHACPQRILMSRNAMVLDEIAAYELPPELSKLAVYKQRAGGLFHDL